MALWKKALLTFIIYYIILFVGAAIIMYIEAVGLRRIPIRENITEPLKKLFETELQVSTNRSTLEKIIAISRKISEETKAEQARQWKREASWETLYKWKYFTHVTLTTLGYGNIVPETDGGKVFVIIYGAIGIPINIIFIATLGGLFSEISSALIKTVEKRVFRVRRFKHVEMKTSLLLMIFSIMWLAAGARVNTTVMKWSWTEGYYAAFVRFSTIGYGDYLLQFDKVKDFGELISWYTNIGLALVAGVFDALSGLMQPKVEKASFRKKDAKRDGATGTDKVSTNGNENNALQMNEVSNTGKNSAKNSSTEAVEIEQSQYRDGV